MNHEYDFDVIIPVHKRADWLRLCMTALSVFSKTKLNVILVDNDSDDKDVEYLYSEIERGDPIADNLNVMIKRLTENKSFSNAVNVGIRAGEAPNVVILNTDVVVSEAWDAIFLQELADDNVGIVGAQSGNVSGLQAMGEIGRMLKPGALMFTCVAMRREVVDEVGLLDEETFDGFSTEDVDYSIRVADAGYKLLVSRAVVAHGGSQTLAVTVGDETRRARNNEKYMKRLVDKFGRKRVEKALKANTIPSLLIGTMSAGEQTRVAFMEKLLNLSLKGAPFSTSFGHVRRMLPNHARQAICDTAVRLKRDYVFMIDDDQLPEPDLVKRLVAHDKDVVGVIVYQRREPYQSCVFSFGTGPEEWNLQDYKPHERRKALFQTGCVAPLEGVEHTGLRKVDSIGFGAILIKTSVFEKIDAYLKANKNDPRFLDLQGPKYFGDFSAIGEDLYFAALCQAAGVEIWCDTDVILPHLGDELVIDEAFKQRFLEGRAVVTQPPTIGFNA